MVNLRMGCFRPGRLGPDQILELPAWRCLNSISARRSSKFRVEFSASFCHLTS